jgi:hypothetical protein
VGFSSLALTPKEGIPAFLMKFQDCDSKLRLLGFLELMGALGEVSTGCCSKSPIQKYLNI